MDQQGAEAAKRPEATQQATSATLIRNADPKKTPEKARPVSGRTSPDLIDRKRVSPLVLTSSPSLRASAPNTPEAGLDKKRVSAASRFLQKEKLHGGGTPTQSGRKRGGSLLIQGTPTPSNSQAKAARKAMPMSTTPPLDGDYDYDFTKTLQVSSESQGRFLESGKTELSGAATPSPTAQQRKVVTANPLIADQRSQWGQSDNLEDWVNMINTPVDAPVRPAEKEEPASCSSSSSSSDSGSNSGSSSSSGSDEDEDETSDGSDSPSSSSSSSSSSAGTVAEVESKDSRARFLEEEDELLSSSDSHSGSRISKSLPLLTPDVVRVRAARDLEVLASLVPARVLYAHASGMRPRGAQLKPMREEFDGAVLFADISGFSRLAEALVRRQTPSGAAESLTKYVGWNLHEMVEVICGKGGDVMKFAGDAILAVFAADQFEGNLAKAAVCCAQTALALQQLELYAGDVKLEVHSGMGVGRVATYEVGGLQDRWEVFVAGPPVTQIGKCEPQAKAGELVVSSEARQCIETLTRVRGAMVEDGNFRLDKILDPIDFKERVSAAKELSHLAQEDPDKAVELKRALQKYLSRPVIFSIESHGQTLWGAELRICSTIFVKFKGLQFNDHCEEDLALVQYVVKNVVQKVMASLEGTVCRFMVDDKGAAMLLAFGLIPFAHPNDSVRAVKAALEIRDGVAALSFNKPELSKRALPPSSTAAAAKELNGHGPPPTDEEDDSTQRDPSPSASPSKAMPRKRLSSRYKLYASDPGVVRTILHREYTPVPQMPVSCQIGITRGKVCVGMVGGSTRCEYTLHGVLVNRAARLMGSATDGVILCDHDTYHEARDEVEFDPDPVPLKLKGERKDVKVYKPMRKTATRNKMSSATASMSAGTPGAGGNNGADDEGLVGRQKERAEIEEVFKKLSDENPWAGVIGVQGESGVGKTRMLQYVTKVAKKYRATVLWGFALDTEASTPFFAWKSIVMQLLSLVVQGKPSLPGPAPQNAVQVLQSVSSKETMTSHGSTHSFTSGGNATFGGSPKQRKIRSGSTRMAPLSPSAGPAGNKMDAVGSPKPQAANPGTGNAVSPSGNAVILQQQMSSTGPGMPRRTFEEMNVEERKECLLEALPLDKRELYPLLAPLVDEAIPPSLLADNEATSSIARNQRLSVAIETVVAMISYFATRLQQRGERLCIIMEDAQWMDASSIDLLLEIAKHVPRHAIFVSGTFSDQNGLARRVPCCTTTWTLFGLEKHEIARCMKQWLHVSKVSEAAVNMIFEKSNGNPLFTEELCRLMSDNHHFEIANDACVLSNTGASGETRMNLPNSIIALMTASLDRLDASQQIVLRVVAVMGMQFTLHDLAGVLRAINNTASSASKVFGASSGSRPTVGSIKFDINAEEMTLEQMLKEGTRAAAGGPPATPPHSASKGSLNASASSTASSSESGKPKSNSAGSEGEAADPLNLSTATTKHQQERATIRINVLQVLNSLVQKGILEERAGFVGARRTFIFRHAMMKETACDELLREESKQSLHQIIGEYYEERPGTDQAQWHAILAEHFFASGDKAKARKYLELAGDGAVQNHAMQQVFQCYSRLIKLAQHEAVPRLTRAQWSRKVGEALFHMDRNLQAEEHLHESLEILQLDCRDAPAMSGSESGFFPKPSASERWLTAACCGNGASMLDESVALRPRPSGLGRVVSRFFRPNGWPGEDEDDEYAEEFERFISKGDSTPSAMGQPLFFTSALNQGLAGSSSTLPSPFANESSATLVLDPSAESKRASMRQQSNGGLSGSNSVKMKPRQRTMSMVEPQSPLRPRLLIAIDAFKQLKQQLIKGATRQEREAALEVLLEAALVYDLLGRMLRDRSSSVALERRLNAILLAEAASFSLDDAQQQQVLQAARGAAGRGKKGTSRVHRVLQAVGLASPRSASKTSSQSEATAAQLWASQQVQSQMEATALLYQAATLGGGAMPSPAAPAVSPAQQRIYDELSRAYSRAAVFFAGMHPGTRWRGLAKAYAYKASQFMQTPTGQIYRADLAQHSENLVILQQRCGEYDAMQGNFAEASEKLSFAVWGARFLHLDRAMIDSKVLELTVFFFNGDLDSCNTTAWELFEKNMATPRNVALGARFMALCGDYEVTVHKLRSLAKLNGPLGGSNDEELSSFERGLEALADANAWLALSLVAWRKDENGRLAVRAIKQAAEAVLCSELSDAPLPAFHIVALCFTALWDAVRDSSQPLFELGKDLQNLEQMLKRLLAVVRSYAVVYKVCRPHALYCVALRSLILQRAHHAAAAAASSPPPSPAFEESALGGDGSSPSGACLGGLLARTNMPLDPFFECAIKARRAMCYWTEGLALLELDDVQSWIEAREIFMQYQHAEYELVRCEKKLAFYGITVPDEGEPTSMPQVEG